MTHLSSPGRVRGDREALETHLRGALDWMARAQDVTDDGGVSGGYTALKGWTASFPETTGYIVPTFLNARTWTGEEAYAERALRMGEWLLGLQQPSGAFSGGLVGDGAGPSVFNTGQIVYGLLRLHEVTGEERWLATAHRAGSWLADVQEPTGAWTRFDFMETAHVYNTRTAWPLLLLAAATGDERLGEAGARNVAWALEQSDADGFFRRAAFAEPAGPVGALRRAVAGKNLPSFYTRASLHTIAYTIQGLLESAWLLADDAAAAAATRAAEALARDAADGVLAGWYGPGWRRRSRSLCLTGAAQMAIVWLRLVQRGEERFLAAADRTLAVLGLAQSLEDRRPHRRGGLAGSDPVWGMYLPYRWPNWAAKFAADAFQLRLLLDAPPAAAADYRVW
jgi:hypothetical protein